MKFRNLVFLFVIAIILIAWFTKPEYKDFVLFQEKQDAHPGIPPSIEYEDRFLFSQIKVVYYETREMESSGPEGQRTALAVPVSTEKFIGLFGRFWSID